MDYSYAVILKTNWFLLPSSWQIMLVIKVSKIMPADKFDENLGPSYGFLPLSFSNFRL